MPTKPSTVKQPNLTAKAFLGDLKRLQSDVELKKIQRYFKLGEGQYGAGDKFMGVKMGQLFALAKSTMICRLMRSKNFWRAISTKQGQEG